MIVGNMSFMDWTAGVGKNQGLALYLYNLRFMVLVNYLVQLLKKVCHALVETFTYCFTVAFVYISLSQKVMFVGFQTVFYVC